MSLKSSPTYNLAPSTTLTQLFSLVVFCLFLNGCATLGKDFDAGVLDDLTIEVSRKSDVKEQLGVPWRVGKENGLTVWTYGLYKYSVFRQAFAKDLVLRFDDAGILKSYSYNTTEITDTSHRSRNIPE